MRARRLTSDARSTAAASATKQVRLVAEAHRQGDGERVADLILRVDRSVRLSSRIRRLLVVVGWVCRAVVVRNDPTNTLPKLHARCWRPSRSLGQPVTRGGWWRNLANEAEERAGGADREGDAGGWTGGGRGARPDRPRDARRGRASEQRDRAAIDGVRHVLPADLVEQQEALRRAEECGPVALTELRGLLGAMQEAGEDLERVPQRGSRTWARWGGGAPERTDLECARGG